MTTLQLSTPAWPTITDDTGDGVSGTILGQTVTDAIRDAINGLVHSSTNPGVTPEDAIDEVVAARGSKADLNTRLSISLTAAGLLAVGGGTTIKRLEIGTVSVNPPSIAATTRSSATATISGVAVGDVVLMIPPSGLNAGLLVSGNAYVSGVDTVTIPIYNATGGAVDDGALTWTYLWLDAT